MRLSPKEIDKLLLHQACFLAQKRYARGLKLNYPESIALIAGQLLEFIREGYTVADLMNRGKQILSIADVMEGVSSMIAEVQVEGTFPDGTKLITVHHPICHESLDNEWALYGSGLFKSVHKIIVDNISHESPGKYIIAGDDIIINEGRKTIRMIVTNKGDRPVQVGSHYPFAETNKMLELEREKALNYRLNIPSGTAVRFEPGESKEVELVEFAGEKSIYGGNNLIKGKVDEQTYFHIVSNMKSLGFIK
ncbi:MAG: urease subunit gamma [Bacteroidota bacterium]